MAKPLVLTLIFASASIAYSQNQSQFVRFYGKTFNQADSSEAVVNIRYEKLPYYDDMGMAKTTESGDFEFYLQEGQTYFIEFSGERVLVYNTEVTMNDEDNDGEIRKDFYLEQDPAFAEPDIMTLENVIFGRGSDVITGSSHQELDDLVVWLDEHPSMIIQLEGHTDFAGNAEANMRLSQARVEAVKNYLTDKGINKKRVLTKAYGGTQPLFTERTDEAKAKNRRVEVRVISR